MSQPLTRRPARLRVLPASTKAPLESVNPLLSFNIRSWLQNHGKTVKPKLTEEQKANLRTCFRMMDADGSGAIDAEELGAAFKLLGLSLSRKEVEAMLQVVDRDGSGEVEYPEFLEIMTMQLTRLAAQKEEEEAAAAAAVAAAAAAGGRRSPERHGSGQEQQDDSGSDGAGDACASSVVTAAAAAASLPFDVVVTAYRRKKLMGALEEDDKDFILSVAAAEEEERRRAEQEADLARRRSRGSAAIATGLGARPGMASMLPSHAAFLASLSREEWRIIESLSKKYHDKLGMAAEPQQRRLQRQATPLQRPGSEVAAAHLAALQAESRAAPGGQQAGAGAGATAAACGAGKGGERPGSTPPRYKSMTLPDSRAATECKDFRLQYRLTKSTAAGTSRAASAAAGVGSATEGLTLPLPHFGSAIFGG